MQDKAYIHGYSASEQQRLIAQAEILAPSVFAGLHLPHSGRLLELGCGVGAQLKRMAQLRPGLRLTGIDLNPRHLLAARKHLHSECRQGRVDLLRADAGQAPFRPRSFDHIVTIWMLEHVADPAAIIAQALSLLRPGGSLVCTEVNNQCFGFIPEYPAIRNWWRQFNRYQAEHGGNPYIGGQLAQVAKAAGARDFSIQELHILDSREEPERRLCLLDYLHNLLRSGAPNLIQHGYADADALKALERDFTQARDKQADFFYHGARLIIRRPA